MEDVVVCGGIVCEGCEGWVSFEGGGGGGFLLEVVEGFLLKGGVEGCLLRGVGEVASGWPRVSVEG